MRSVLHIAGPSGAGPGEREEMLARMAAYLDQMEVTERVRLDVPQRGSELEGTGSVRGELEPLIPAMQSGSLFGDRMGVEVVDAQWIQASEATVIADLLHGIDPNSVAIVFVAAGAVPRALADALKATAEKISISKIRDRDVRDLLGAELKQRGLEADRDGSQALLRRFGTDIGSLRRALDQLEGTEHKITRTMVLERFKNRPEEGMWHYTDAVSAGRVGEALMHLDALLTHTHPLALVGALESDLRQKAYASAAPDFETFTEWMPPRTQSWKAEKLWKVRGKVSDSDLHRAVSALARADRILKSAPEETHRLTMERLTVALCRWYSRRS